ncbi:uncharacterized protein LOC115444261 [Manduca sexta]|uniref:Protein sleepless n=1 Tax=Manduca sexta TaxID=7130 RepID=A0A921YJH7_MANSE|nr:uncharacterized protein LOC115444261 [Manduca sexta]KAG6440349.1 hypothetical protein O3G_MSEX001227 [Manduca sexta]
MTSMNKLIFVVTTLLSIVSRCSSIYCYYCNSAENSACLDLTKYDPNTLAINIPIVNCATAVPAPMTTEFFCRKIVQTIFNHHKEPEVRITRGCGWQTSQEPCYTTKSNSHYGTSCQCFSDYCNSGDKLDSTTATALFLALAACLYFYR